jgi:hypothetical protein
MTISVPVLTGIRYILVDEASFPSNLLSSAGTIFVPVTGFTWRQTQLDIEYNRELVWELSGIKASEIPENLKLWRIRESVRSADELQNQYQPKVKCVFGQCTHPSCWNCKSNANHKYHKSFEDNDVIMMFDEEPSGDEDEEGKAVPLVTGNVAGWAGLRDYHVAHGNNRFAGAEINSERSPDEVVLAEFQRGSRAQVHHEVVEGEVAPEHGRRYRLIPVHLNATDSANMLALESIEADNLYLQSLLENRLHGLDEYRDELENIAQRALGRGDLTHEEYEAIHAEYYRHARIEIFPQVTPNESDASASILSSGRSSLTMSNPGSGGSAPRNLFPERFRCRHCLQIIDLSFVTDEHPHCAALAETQSGNNIYYTIYYCCIPNMFVNKFYLFLRRHLVSERTLSYQLLCQLYRRV